MAKSSIIFGCTSCGFEHHKWQGQCNGCREWNTIVEFDKGEGKKGSKSKSRTKTMVGGSSKKPTKIKEVKGGEYPGFSSGIEGFDRILGGKIFNGSVTLVAAEPGKGKSTLMLQVAGKVAASGKTVIYATGEESEVQVKDRANRLEVGEGNLYLFNTEDLGEVLDASEELKPDLIVVDSIQHITSEEETGAPGSVKQVQKAAFELVSLAKTTGVSIFAIGHITKDEKVAGPKKLEHMVDVVLFLGGDKTTDLRLAYCSKNRFGSTNEVTLFTMDGNGMNEIKNPSEHLIAHRSESDSGSTIVCTTGKRPLLIEVQSLVVETGYENAIPRRTSRGYERDRFNIMVAVLEKKCGLRLGNKDVYLNVVGGIRLEDTSSDLGVAMAIASSEKDKAIKGNVVFIGEVGLGGEVRPVKDVEQLVKEAETNGFDGVVVPKASVEIANRTANKIKIHGVNNLKTAIKDFL